MAALHTGIHLVLDELDAEDYHNTQSEFATDRTDKIQLTPQLHNSSGRAAGASMGSLRVATMCEYYIPLLVFLSDC